MYVRECLCTYVYRRVDVYMYMLLLHTPMYSYMRARIIVDVNTLSSFLDVINSPFISGRFNEVMSPRKSINKQKTA